METAARCTEHIRALKSQTRNGRGMSLQYIFGHLGHIDERMSMVRIQFGHVVFIHCAHPYPLPNPCLLLFPLNKHIHLCPNMLFSYFPPIESLPLSLLNDSTPCHCGSYLCFTLDHCEMQLLILFPYYLTQDSQCGFLLSSWDWSRFYDY